MPWNDKDALTPQALNSRSGPIFNVKDPDFGATGDNVTDDAPAIQAAHDALPAGGGIIFLPTGNYLLGSTLELSKQVHLVGVGRSILADDVNPGTRIVKDDTISGAGIRVSGGNDSAGSILSGFQLDAVGGSGGDGIAVETNFVGIIDVSVVNQARDGIRIGADTATNVNSWYIQNCSLSDNTRHGLNIDDPAGVPDANAGTLVHVASLRNGGDGLRVGKARFNSFFGLSVEANTGAGVRLTSNAQRNQFFGGDWQEGNVAGNLIVEAGALNNAIIYPELTPAGYTNAGTRTVISLTGIAPSINRDTFLQKDLPINQAVPNLSSTVTEGSVFECVNTESTNITNFVVAYNEQRIIIRFDANTGMIHNASAIRLQGSVSLVPGSRTTDDFISLIIIDDDVWQEEYRSFPPSNGFRQTVDGWTQENVAASQTDVELTRDTRWTAPRGGSVTGIALASTEGRSAGEMTISVFKNTGLAGASGSTIGLSAALDAGEVAVGRDSVTQLPGLDTFAAGDELYITVTTNGDWAPTTADIRCSLEVET